MDELLNRILELYSENRWKDVLSLNQDSRNIYALKLLWVWPSEKNLWFIGKVLKELQCGGITSIGCGCGLLEWIIKESCGVDVQGFEVNREWWDSKYSNPQFISLQYFNDPLSKTSLNSQYALMFCYFNNRPAFREYMRHYLGTVVIIIGPGENAGRHTDPVPFKPDFEQDYWKLYSYEEIKDTLDFIAVYIKV